MEKWLIDSANGSTIGAASDYLILGFIDGFVDGYAYWGAD